MARQASIFIVSVAAAVAVHTIAIPYANRMAMPCTQNIFTMFAAFMAFDCVQSNSLNAQLHILRDQSLSLNASYGYVVKICYFYLTFV